MDDHTDDAVGQPQSSHQLDIDTATHPASHTAIDQNGYQSRVIDHNGCQKNECELIEEVEITSLSGKYKLLLVQISPYIQCILDKYNLCSMEESSTTTTTSNAFKLGLHMDLVEATGQVLWFLSDFTAQCAMCATEDFERQKTLSGAIKTVTTFIADPERVDIFQRIIYKWHSIRTCDNEFKCDDSTLDIEETQFLASLLSTLDLRQKDLNGQIEKYYHDLHACMTKKPRSEIGITWISDTAQFTHASWLVETLHALATQIIQMQEKAARNMNLVSTILDSNTALMNSYCQIITIHKTTMQAQKVIMSECTKCIVECVTKCIFLQSVMDVSPDIEAMKEVLSQGQKSQIATEFRNAMTFYWQNATEIMANRPQMNISGTYILDEQDPLMAQIYDTASVLTEKRLSNKQHGLIVKTLKNECMDIETSLLEYCTQQNFDQVTCQEIFHIIEECAESGHVSHHGYDTGRSKTHSHLSFTPSEHKNFAYQIVACMQANNVLTNIRNSKWIPIDENKGTS